MKCVTHDWYEAVLVGGYGCKLADIFNTAEEAVQGVKETNTRVVARGFKSGSYHIMMCSTTRTIDDNNDVISERTNRTSLYTVS